MMTNNGDARSDVLSLLQDSGFQSEIAQIESKAFLSEVAKEPAQVNWTYILQRVIKNMVLATVDLENIARVAPQEMGELRQAASQIASTWESLAKLQEGATQNTALLNAAVNYELAGYQANAAYLASRLASSRGQSDRPTLSELCSTFLQRRFLRSLDLARQAQTQPKIDGRSDNFVAEALAVAAAARGLSSAVRFFLRGEEAWLPYASDWLARSESMFASLALAEEANLARSLRSLLPTMQRRSTWTYLSDKASGRPKWQRYLKLLARGVGNDVYKSRSISELWPSQTCALERGLLDTTASKIVRMPTSAGKTRIAELAIVHTLVNDPLAKCVYVAPYRALASELEQALSALLSDLGYRVSAITGTYETDDFEELLFKLTDVLITTPEKLDLLLRARPELLDEVRLFVLDEVHIIAEEQRGVKFELLLTRLKKRLPSARFLALSAVMPEETLREFAKWFDASTHDDIVTSRWRPTEQRYAKFEWTGQNEKQKTGRLSYARDKQTKVPSFVPGVVRQQPFTYIKEETGRRNTKTFPESGNKAQTVAELAFRFADLGPVLVFCSQRRYAEAVAKALNRRLELSALAGHEIPSHFVENGKTRAAMLADEWLGDRPITSWLKSGIGVHYRNLPDVIRKALEADFRERKIRVLIATSTLAQGVNLPVKTVVFHSCWRYSEDNPRVRVSARDYWNVAGRAGRAGEETEGLVIHTTLTEQDERDYEYYLSKRDNVDPVDSALFQRLRDLAQGRLTEDALKAELDSEVLALLVEEASDLRPEEIVRNAFDGSLVRVQAQRDQAWVNQLPRLETAFVEVANEVSEWVPSPERRALYSPTGLSTSSCRVIYDHIEANKPHVQELLLDAGPGQIDDLVDLLLPVCLRLSEMAPEIQFGGSFEDLLSYWISGRSLRSLMANFKDDANSPELLGRFIDDLFRYKLPWGISGYLRIAAESLGLDRSQLSQYARFLPSMIKYGVPDPTACWALSIGVPSRLIAMKVAVAYEAEALATTSYEAFLDWLGGLSRERLRREFELQSPLLEETTRAIFLASLNPMLQDESPLRGFLPREERVHDIDPDDPALQLRIRSNQLVELKRDYDDLVDKNAISVNLLQQRIGNLPRRVAQVLAPEMDTGLQLAGEIMKVADGQPLKVTVLISESK